MNRLNVFLRFNASRNDIIIIIIIHVSKVLMEQEISISGIFYYVFICQNENYIWESTYMYVWQTKYLKIINKYLVDDYVCGLNG